LQREREDRRDGGEREHDERYGCYLQAAFGACSEGDEKEHYGDGDESDESGAEDDRIGVEALRGRLHLEDNSLIAEKWVGGRDMSEREVERGV